MKIRMCKKFFSTARSTHTPNEGILKSHWDFCSEGVLVSNKFSIIRHLLMFPKLHWAKNHWDVLIKNIYSLTSSPNPINQNLQERSWGDQLLSEVQDYFYCQGNLLERHWRTKRVTQDPHKTNHFLETFQ